MSMEFEHPPVNEVAISVFFNPHLANFRNEHVGLYWEKIKSVFPTVKQQIPVNFDLQFDRDEVSPLPRYWFISGDQTNLIQLQKKAFIFNWRHREGSAYPRYQGIKPAFDEQYAIFSEFVRTEIGMTELTIGTCDLTYVNSIKAGEFWAGPQQTRNVIPSFSPIHIGTDSVEHSAFNYNYTYKLSNELQITININSALQVPPDNAPVLTFEIKASNQIQGGSQDVPDEWFQAAHTAILDCFLKMTDETIQKERWIPLTDTP